MTGDGSPHVPGFRDYSFPLEGVSSVADFVRVLLRMRIENKRETYP
jgi:hypothetical protein